jgi:hypothetical protein
LIVVKGKTRTMAPRRPKTNTKKKVTKLKSPPAGLKRKNKKHVATAPTTTSDVEDEDEVGVEEVEAEIVTATPRVLGKPKDDAAYEESDKEDMETELKDADSQHKIAHKHSPNKKKKP